MNVPLGDKSREMQQRMADFQHTCSPTGLFFASQKANDAMKFVPRFNVRLYTQSYYI